MKLFVPITKLDVEKREVWGRAVQEVPDRAKEIFDYETSVPYFKDWSAGFEKATAALPEPSLGNIRAMHGKVAAGKAIAINFDDAAKSVDLGTKIVDDNEWQKCLDGVYTGFSIGGSYVKRWPDEADPTLTRYTACPNEISLVDSPCVPTALFSVVKSATETESRPFQHYGLLKIALASPNLTIGDVLTLGEQYLPSDTLNALHKADATMGSLLEQLQALAKAAGAPSSVEPTAAADPAADPASAAGVTETSATAEAAATDPADAAPATSETPAATDDTPAQKRTLSHLRKGMYSVSTFAGIIQSLAWLAQDSQAEESWENDASEIPGDLRTAIQLLCEIFKKMSAEETDELIASLLPAGETVEIIELAAPSGSLAKAGKRHSAGDQRLVQSMHDQSVELGATCSTGDDSDAEKLAKLAPALALGDSADALTTLGKAVSLALGAAPSGTAATAEQIETLAKHTIALTEKVAVLSAIPMPPKGVTRVVGKTDDDEPIGKVTEAPAPDPTNPFGVMKAVHEAGGRRITL